MSKELIAALERCVQVFDEIGFKSHAEDAREALSRHRSSVESVELPEPDDAVLYGGVVDVYYDSTVRSLIAAAVEREREAIIQMMPGGHSVDPQAVCDAIRARGEMP